jgi:mannose-6-phosphate isomerase-like protein (cupin superfamily)
MERTHGTWGEKWNIFQNDLNEVSILYLVPNQRCSYHSHNCKYNLFFVLEGQLFIKTDLGISTLEKGQIFTTKPGEMHEFQTAVKQTIIIEIMYVKYDPEDINRTELGGVLLKE